MWILAYDKDLAQLVNDRCSLVDANLGSTDARGVERRWGVPPERIRLLLSWMGDSADGLPGVRGYGQKRSVHPALDGRIGDRLTYELAALADVPESELLWRTVHPGPTEVRQSVGLLVAPALE